MTSILGATTYPFHREDARRLHMALSQLYPAPQSALLLAQQAGMDASMIFISQPPFLLWKDILDQAVNEGLLCQLLQAVKQRLNASSPFRPLLDDVLADRPVRASGGPRNDDGAPHFIYDTDQVHEPEALLYQDDLSIQIGRVPALISTLQGLLALSPSVCKLTIEIGSAGQFGTAFRIGPDRLLTNWHVVHATTDGAAATAITAEFGYEDDGAGGVRAATAIRCDPASVRSSRDDDWAVIRTQDPLSPDWTVVRLENAAMPVLGGAAFVIQHPQGARKRVSIVRNQVSFFDDRVVQYLADTQVGSSGAPVFNQAGRLIALHHAGGRPQEVLGKAPVRKNEGIRIARIIENLAGK